MHAKMIVASVSNGEDVSHQNRKQLRECCLDSVEIVGGREAGWSFVRDGDGLDYSARYIDRKIDAPNCEVLLVIGQVGGGTSVFAGVFTCK
jgi:hypothetical protein